MYQKYISAKIVICQTNYEYLIETYDLCPVNIKMTNFLGTLFTKKSIIFLLKNLVRKRHFNLFLFECLAKGADGSRPQAAGATSSDEFSSSSCIVCIVIIVTHSTSGGNGKNNSGATTND